jgi:hypothetical protein
MPKQVFTTEGTENLRENLFELSVFSVPSVPLW